MLKAKMEVELNQQVNFELESAYLYLSMSCDMKHKGYDGVASWFAHQAKEEYGHAAHLMKYIGEMDGKVKLAPIGEVRQEWNSPKDVFEDTLMHEKRITERIYALLDLAVELKDYPTQNMLKWFVDEQVEEESIARSIVERMKKVENYPVALFALDSQLGQRVANDN